MDLALETLLKELQKIRSRGWIATRRPGNSGAVGNTLEDLLGIPENNRSNPDAGEWELKCQRRSTGALTTLLHSEPEPRHVRVVPQLLLPHYGWPHRSMENMASFRQTLSGLVPSDRGFQVVIDRRLGRLSISFAAAAVAHHHHLWLKAVEGRIGLGELLPQPFWTFTELERTLSTKLTNCIYVLARTRKIQGVEHFHYYKILRLEGFEFERFLHSLECGDVLVDFDARTGHNHGTKFRLKRGGLQSLYASTTEF